MPTFHLFPDNMFFTLPKYLSKIRYNSRLIRVAIITHMKYKTICVKSADKLLSVSADGFETAGCVDSITVNASRYKAKLAFLNDESFYTVLRNKLHWGISPTD